MGITCIADRQKTNNAIERIARSGKLKRAKKSILRIYACLKAKGMGLTEGLAKAYAC
jgi:hypothetical protein